MTPFLNYFELTPHDFALGTNWKIVKKPDSDKPYLVDAEGKKWRQYHSINDDRFWCALHALIQNPLMHTIGVIGMIAYRALRVCTLFPLLAASEKPLSWKDRFTTLGIETLQIFLSPFLLIALEAVALYGIFQPRDGIKLHQSISTLIYGYPASDKDIISKPLPITY